MVEKTKIVPLVSKKITDYTVVKNTDKITFVTFGHTKKERFQKIVKGRDSGKIRVLQAKLFTYFWYTLSKPWARPEASWDVTSKCAETEKGDFVCRRSLNRNTDISRVRRLNRNTDSSKGV